MARIALAIWIMAAFFIGAWQAQGVTDSFETKCPPVEAIKEAAQKTFNRKIDVIDISPSPIKGLCQVHIRLHGKNRFIYTDPKGEYLIAGNIFRVSDHVNITKESISQLNRLSPEDMEKLASLTAFTVGKGGKVVYLVTDPHCPFCQRAEDILMPLVDSGQITVRFILYPLAIHKGARQECISIICDDKGLEGLRNRYRSDNQCDAGKKKVQDTINFLQKNGITGTPTYIFPDGHFHAGVLNEQALRNRLGIDKKK